MSPSSNKFIIFLSPSNGLNLYFNTYIHIMKFIDYTKHILHNPIIRIFRNTLHYNQ